MPKQRFARLISSLLIALLPACWGEPESSRDPSGPADERELRPAYRTDSPVKRACALPEEQLARIWRGYHGARSEDVIVVPRKPAFFGSFTGVNHSGPWDFLQEIPLVLYGPDRITPSGPMQGAATLADVYPTVGELVGVDLEPRSGNVLDESLEQDARGRPKLVVTIVWDGVGRNVLKFWRRKWPVLARLEREGTSYREATVASSPSITPATHATLGTGAFPRRHHVTGIYMRGPDGLHEAFEGTVPTDLRMETFADQIDSAFRNRSEVGLLGWSDWHLPMMGHGLAQEGGDADDVAIILLDSNVGGNSSYFSTPAYLDGFPGLADRADELDRADGKADERWLGHEILAETQNPAWVAYATDMLLAMLKNERYGADRVTDFMFVNYKMTDYIGHTEQFESKEMAAVLEAQDRALGRLLRYLDGSVGDYVVIVTADHGHTPNPTRSGGWPIGQGSLKDDINAYFEVPDDASLVEDITAVGIFLDRSVMVETRTTARQVARFVNAYTIGQNNARTRLPPGFRGRGHEEVFAAAWPGADLDAVIRCRFDSARPTGEPS